MMTAMRVLPVLVVVASGCCPKLVHREVTATPPVPGTVTRARLVVEAHDSLPAYCPGAINVMRGSGNGQGWVTHELVIDHAAGETKVRLLSSSVYTAELADEPYDLRFVDGVLGVHRGTRSGWMVMDLSVPKQPFICEHRLATSPSRASSRAAMLSVLASLSAGGPDPHFGDSHGLDSWSTEIAAAAHAACVATDDVELGRALARAFVRRGIWSTNPWIDLVDCIVERAATDAEIREIIAAGPVFDTPPDFVRDGPAMEAKTAVFRAQRRLGLAEP